jgi:hypothetical protein
LKEYLTIDMDVYGITLKCLKDPSDLMPITKDGKRKGIVLVPFTNPRYPKDCWRNILHFECMSSTSLGTNAIFN